jgi:Protein of unknown function (DUF1404)
MVNLNLGDYEGRTNLLISVCAASIAVLLLPPLDAIENTNLTARMVEDTLLIVYSISMGYGLERWFTMRDPASKSLEAGVRSAGVRPRKNWTRSLVFGLIIPTAVLAYWNFPATFDVTASNVGMRYLADGTYILMGVLIGTAVTSMPTGLRAGLLLLTFLSVGMMGSMMLVWQPGFYTAYSPGQNLQSNTFLMLLGSSGILISGAWTLRILSII